jgi:hypothetical protein
VVRRRIQLRKPQGIAAVIPLPDRLLPPSLEALADPAPLPLQSVAIRMDSVALARVEAVRDRLNRPSRAALLRFLVNEGLRHAEATLEQAAR